MGPTNKIIVRSHNQTQILWFTQNMETTTKTNWFNISTPTYGVCFLESGFQTFLCLFAFRKVGQRKTLSGQRKTLSSQRKTWLGFQKSVYFGRKTLSGSCEKFRNVILFVDYIKFGPQTFDCYIYIYIYIYIFCFEYLFFNFIP